MKKANKYLGLYMLGLLYSLFFFNDYKTNKNDYTVSNSTYPSDTIVNTLFYSRLCDLQEEIADKSLLKKRCSRP